MLYKLSKEDNTIELMILPIHTFSEVKLAQM